jgi:hypothetical protein
MLQLVRSGASGLEESSFAGSSPRNKVLKYPQQKASEALKKQIKELQITTLNRQELNCFNTSRYGILCD